MVGGHPWEADEENKEEDSMSKDAIESAVLEEIGRTVVDVPMREQRSLATVTAEIRTIRAARDKMFLEASVEIGRRLKEAKDLVGHGGWGEYCRTELDFSQQTAQNHIRLFEAYAADQIRLDGAALKSQTLGNLSYTQALELLALPSEEEREAFVREHDMASLSTRELREELRRRTGADPSTAAGGGPPPLQAEEVSEGALLAEMFDAGRQGQAAAEDQASETDLLRDRLKAAEDEARTVGERWEAAMDEIRSQNIRQEKLEEQAKQAASQLAAAEALAKAAEGKAVDLEKKLKEAKAAEKKALQELKQAQKNPAVSEDLLAQLKAEAEEAAAKSHEAEYGELDQARKDKANAEAALLRAKQEAAVAAQKAEAAEKALRLAAPEMAVFKASFERVQGELLALVGSVDELPADKQAGAWKAMAALVGQISRIVEGHTEVVRE